MAFQKLARLQDVPPGQTKFVCTATKPVVLANWKGGIYALYGLCPHRNNLLEGARLWDNLLDCPWHHYQYDVRTGANYFPANVYPKDLPHLRQQLKTLETYPVELREGEIWVDVK